MMRAKKYSVPVWTADEVRADKELCGLKARPRRSCGRRAYARRAKRDDLWRARRAGGKARGKATEHAVCKIELKPRRKHGGYQNTFRKMHWVRAMRKGLPVRRDRGRGKKGAYPRQLHALRRVRVVLQVRGDRLYEGRAAGKADISAFSGVWVFAEQKGGQPVGVRTSCSGRAGSWRTTRRTAPRLSAGGPALSRPPYR